MLHLIMEYADTVTERVNVAALLEDLHQCVLATDIFEPNQVISRSYASHDWLVGEDVGHTHFIHLQVRVATGHVDTVRKEIAPQLLEQITPFVQDIDSVSLDIVEIEVETTSHAMLLDRV